MTKEKYYERLEKGLCPRCGKSKSDRFTYCLDCRIEQRERRATYIKYKVCPVCKVEKLYGDERTCNFCKIKRMGSDKAYRNKNKDRIARQRKERRRMGNEVQEVSRP